MHGRKHRLGGEGPGRGKDGGPAARQPGKRPRTQDLDGREADADPRKAATKQAGDDVAEDEAAEHEGEDAQATDAAAEGQGKGKGKGERGGDEAAAHEGEAGSGGGFGIADVMSNIGDAVGATVATAMGQPYVIHRTADAAPAAPNSRTKVGVGELVTFSSNMPGKWKVTKAGSGFPKKGTGDQFMWAAMDTKGTATITFDPGKKGVKPIEIKMEVVAPKVDYLNPRAVAFPGQGTGIAGVNMETDVTFLPLDVSFASTMWWEKPGPATNAKGYFREHVTKRHHQLPFHHPNPDDLQIDGNNSGVTDTAGFWDFGGPFKEGSFEWVIPTYYRVLDGPRHLITNVHQTCSIDGSGTMSVTKGSASLSNPLT